MRIQKLTCQNLNPTSKLCYNTVIISSKWDQLFWMPGSTSSLLESYRPTLQTITAAERTSQLAGGQMSGMKHNDLISFILEEAQHRVINDECIKSAETALAAHTKKGKQNKSRKQKKAEKSSKSTTEECDNCGRPGHTIADCYSKSGGKEADAPWKKKDKKSETATVAAVNDDDNDLFAFTCTSDFANVAESSKILKSKFGTCVNSRASNDYSPDRTRFTNYREVERDITTADGRILKAIGMGDLHLDLPNGSKKTQAVLKNTVHAPKMAFTLLSISKLDKADHKVIFHKQMCTIMNPKGHTIAKIPHLQGLYHVLSSPQSLTQLTANFASEKLSINEAHH